MKYGQVAGIDKKVSRLVQGCMMLSEKDQEALDESFAKLDRAFAAGINTFDNGHIYGGGRCDRAFGKWLAARGNKDEVVILAKGCHHNQDRKRVTPFDLTADLADSMARMEVDHIDLWMFHRDDESQPVGPLVDCLNGHIEAGRISAYGASNWSTSRIAEANAYAKANGLIGFAASSPNFSLAEQVDEPWPDCTTISGPERADDRAWYREQDMPVFTWSSLARGFLSGRLNRANVDAVKDQFEELVLRCYATEDNWRRIDRCEALAAKKGLTVAQVALAWVLHQDLNIFALVASYNEEELTANVGALEAGLTADEVAWLDLAEVSV